MSDGNEKASSLNASQTSKSKTVSFSVEEAKSPLTERPRLLTPIAEVAPAAAGVVSFNQADAVKLALSHARDEDGTPGSTPQLDVAAPVEQVQGSPAKAAPADVTPAPSAPDAGKAAAPLKSALRRDMTITAVKHKRLMYCDDCKKEIPYEEWLNHRDRLRPVEIKQRITGLQKYIVSLFVDFVMWVVVNVYFREVAVVGLEKVPKTGPVVFYGNHQNQFIDAMMMRAHCGRGVRFIIAEKSMSRPVIGHFARMMEAVPVIRPQDVPSLVGQGKMVRMEKNVVFGEGTSFVTGLAQGDVISWAVEGKKERCSGQVHQIINDTELTLTMPIKDDDAVTQPTPFKCSRRIDHSEMYADVYNTLANNQCIGIFPEGGSHDRTSLLPLKAGVALFSLGASERHIPVQVVPCGLTYFYGNKFRSRAHIEFGDPILPSNEIIDMFTHDKRGATGRFLEELAVALRGVTINVADWGALKFLHAFRRLYQPPDCILTTGDYLKLTRRLAVILEDNESDPQFADFRSKVENYSDYCAALLVRDSQAATLEKLDDTQSTVVVTLLFRRLVILMVMCVVLIPFFIIAAPIGLVTHIAAEHHAKTALSASSVKVVAADVKGSYKIIVGFALVPLEMFLVSVLVFLYSDFHTALTVLVSLPMALYVSLLILQECVLELRAALPLVMSLFSKHKQFKKLYDRRLKLIGMAQAIVKRFDAGLNGELAAYRNASTTQVREPSLFSLRHSARRQADKMK